MESGIKIQSISKISPLYRLGIKEGDTILKINGQPAVDFLDLVFVDSDEDILLEVAGRGKIKVKKKPWQSLGIEVEEIKIRKCTNKCIFCFVHQMPRGLRRELYIKDEDYRLSFLYGNYITLTSLEKGDLDRIARLHLSPLYISVHAVTPAVRQSLICPIKDNFFENFEYLRSAGIDVHTQIVVVPGYNDGDELNKTLEYLLSQENVLSIAVVPVGLTKFRKNLVKIRGLTSREAQQIIETVEEFKNQRDIVYAADEMFIKAQITIPTADYYNDFPQIENGVGMVRSFIDEFQQTLDEPGNYEIRKRVGLITGEDFAPFLKEAVSKIDSEMLQVYPIKNQFFGTSVTVTGLLTASDIFQQTRDIRDIELLVPDVIFSRSFEKKITLDDVSSEDFQKAGISIIESTPQGITNFLKKVQ